MLFVTESIRFSDGFIWGFFSPEWKYEVFPTLKRLWKYLVSVEGSSDTCVPSSCPVLALPRSPATQHWHFSFKYTESNSGTDLDQGCVFKKRKTLALFHFN